MLEDKEGREGIVQFFKLLLSLNSIRLIFISAFAITYMGMTATNRSGKTEAVRESVSIAGDESTTMRVAGAESISARIDAGVFTERRTHQRKFPSHKVLRNGNS